MFTNISRWARFFSTFFEDEHVTVQDQYRKFVIFMAESIFFSHAGNGRIISDGTACLFCSQHFFAIKWKIKSKSIVWRPIVW